VSYKVPVDADPPPTGTIERWAWDYVLRDDMAHKLAPAPLPSAWEDAPPSRRIPAPGRPRRLERLTKAPKSPGSGALRDPERRARLAHTFIHHEIQAAELFAWALLAFPTAPHAFRRGLCAILADEVRHASELAEWLGALRHAYGDFPVRDWFWERVPSAGTPAQFLACLCIGLEGANLDHTARFAARLRAAGDEDGAMLVARIGDEEVSHVRFALRWFERFTTGRTADFETWREQLCAPLTPSVLAARPVHRAARLRAGHSSEFLDALERWLVEHPPGAAPWQSPGS
jgi:uncharacterized ferritin-like protein (DUF455 family)